MVHRTHKRRHTRKHKQRGGGWGYSGIATTTPGGVPLENRASYDHCYDDMRVAPAVSSNPTLWGGRRRSRRQRQRDSRRHRQRGAGCSSCMLQAPPMNGGGAGTGGYSLVFDNSLGKTYSGIDKAACPSAQMGGDGSIGPFPASYGYDTGSAFLSSSAHFLEPKADVSRCASGGRRRSRKGRRHGRK